MKKYSVKVNGAIYEIEIELLEEPASAMRPGHRPPVSGQAQAPAVPRPPATAHTSVGASAGGDRITAPMPGNILDVMVSNGQNVKKGQNLMTLEAMKMENEIMAPCDGIITQLSVVKGGSVNTGDLLCVLS